MNTLHKFAVLTLSAVLTVCLLAGCGDKPQTDNPPPADSQEETGPKKVDKLSVYFVPSREPGEIITVTEPLKQLLKDEMLNQGYDGIDMINAWYS